MSIKEKAIESINDIQASVDEMLNELDSIKGLALERKKELKEELTDIVSSALQDAKQSLEQDEDNSYFLSPFVIAIMFFGEVNGKIGQTKYISELKSGYAKKWLEKDPKQKALKEIETEYEAAKSQFKRRGYSAQFAREMQIKYPVITDIKTIERKATKLNKENQFIPRKLT